MSSRTGHQIWRQGPPGVCFEGTPGAVDSCRDDSAPGWTVSVTNSIKMQVYQQTQDENQASTAPGKAMSGLLGKQPLPRTVRKALGNITNTSRAGEPGLGRQTPAAGLKTARRSTPLGNITNLGKTASRSTQPAHKQQVAQQQKLGAKPLQELQPAAAEPEPPLFDEPIEALAGKGWKQLAAEAEERENQQIAARVRDFWRPARNFSWPCSSQAPLSDLKLKPPAQAPQHSMSPRFSAADWAQPEGPVELPDVGEPDWSIDVISDDETAYEPAPRRNVQRPQVPAAG